MGVQQHEESRWLGLEVAPLLLGDRPGFETGPLACYSVLLSWSLHLTVPCESLGTYSVPIYPISEMGQPSRGTGQNLWTAVSHFSTHHRGPTGTICGSWGSTELGRSPIRPVRPALSDWFIVCIYFL